MISGQQKIKIRRYLLLGSDVWVAPEDRDLHEFIGIPWGFVSENSQPFIEVRSKISGNIRKTINALNCIEIEFL